MTYELVAHESSEKLMENSKLLNKCSSCGTKKQPKELFQYIDGNNKSITKHSPILCYECYINKYGYGK